MKLKQLYVFGAYCLSGFAFTLLAVDVISFSQGMDRGVQIAEEIMSDLCREKKIKVVSNA